MPINQSFLGEMDHEYDTAVKIISRLPEDRLDFKPHEKSMSAGKLASHIAEMYSWAAVTMQMDELNMTPDMKPFVGATKAEILARLEENFQSAKAAIAAGTDDAKWMATWTLKMNGTPLFAMPRVACMRGMVMNHIVHHRGQLLVYLRMMDVPVPQIYGPSADEK